MYTFKQDPDENHISVYIENRWIGLIAKNLAKKKIWGYYFENLSTGADIFCTESDETNTLEDAKKNCTHDFWEVNGEVLIDYWNKILNAKKASE